MPAVCCIKKCLKSLDNRGHTFPADGNLRKKWIKNIGLHNLGPNFEPKPSKRICFRHFKAEDYRLDNSSGEGNSKIGCLVLKNISSTFFEF